MLTLTPAAESKVLEFYASDESTQGKPLRVLVEKGGCSSYQYNFTFDQKKDTDQIFGTDKVQVVIDPESDEILNGSVIDYQESFASSGFVIRNPNAKNACGCGQSFDV